MKLIRRMGIALILIILVMLTACGKDKKSTEIVDTPTPSPVPTATPTPTPTPSPVPTIGVKSMSLYKMMEQEQLYRRYEENYSTRWSSGNEIARLYCIANDTDEIDCSDRSFREIWEGNWNRFEGADQCKICYRIQFKTEDGQTVDQYIMGPEDTESFWDYIRLYLYDDADANNGAFYSYLTADKMQESTRITSLQVKAGPMIDQVYSPVVITAYVYAEWDFDAKGNYIGSTSFRLQLENSDVAAKFDPESKEFHFTTPVESKNGEQDGESAKAAVSLPITITDSKGRTETTKVLTEEEAANPKKKTEKEIAREKEEQALTDSDYETKLSYAAGDTLTITSETEMAGLYIIWGSKSGTYTITAGETEIAGGEAGYLHDYIAFDVPVKECTIKLKQKRDLCGIAAYSAGTLPASVQIWEPSYDKADILIFSAHADDEALFFGGVASLYGGLYKRRVQVVYMCNYWDGYNGGVIREHEKLDGLWAMGIHAYPVNMPFVDNYCMSLADAEALYVYGDILKQVTENIRRFRPLIVVSHDEAGEYGHGGHLILYKAVIEAVNNSMRDDFQNGSYNRYGTWDVPKTYIHLSKENPIHMELRRKEPTLGGKSCLDLAKAGYDMHVSQHIYWFYVSDDYEYSCADFGLVRSTVGKNLTDDMFEHLTCYDAVEARAAWEIEQEEKAKREAEEARRLEEERKAEEERKRAEEQAAEEAKNQKGGKKPGTTVPEKDNGKKVRKVFLALAAIVIGAFLVLAGIVNLSGYIYANIRNKKAAPKADENPAEAEEDDDDLPAVSQNGENE